jgi:hypothetical protein
MTQMQPDAPADSLVQNEGVNAGSEEMLLDEGAPAADVLGGGAADGEDVAGPGDETQSARQLAGAPGSVAAGDAGDEVGGSGQDNGLMDA